MFSCSTVIVARALASADGTTRSPTAISTMITRLMPTPEVSVSSEVRLLRPVHVAPLADQRQRQGDARLVLLRLEATAGPVVRPVELVGGRLVATGILGFVDGVAEFVAEVQQFLGVGLAGVSEAGIGAAFAVGVHELVVCGANGIGRRRGGSGIR